MKDKSLPITYKDWDQAGDYTEMTLYDAEWQEDFGPFKKGEKMNLFLSQLQGVVREYDDKGGYKRQCNIVYTPIDDLKITKSLMKNMLEVFWDNCDCGECGPCELAEEVEEFLGLRPAE